MGIKLEDGFDRNAYKNISAQQHRENLNDITLGELLLDAPTSDAITEYVREIEYRGKPVRLTFKRKSGVKYNKKYNRFNSYHSEILVSDFIIKWDADSFFKSAKSVGPIRKRKLLSTLMMFGFKI
jgi:hypothetical protein